MSHTSIIPNQQKSEMIQKAKERHGPNITVCPKIVSGKLEDSFTLVEPYIILWYNDVSGSTHTITEKVVIVFELLN